MAARCVNGHDTPNRGSCMYCGAPIAAATVAPPVLAYATPPQDPPPRWSSPPPPEQLSALAVVALVLGILWPVGSIPAIIVGWIALRRIESRNQSGRGLAIAGIVLGSLAVLLGVLAAVVVFAVNGVEDKGDDGPGGTTAGSCVAEYRTLTTAAEAYSAQNGAYPTSIAELLRARFLNEGTPDDLRFRMVPGAGSGAPTFEALPGDCEGVGD